MQKALENAKNSVFCKVYEFVDNTIMNSKKMVKLCCCWGSPGSVMPGSPHHEGRQPRLLVLTITAGCGQCYVLV